MTLIGFHAHRAPTDACYIRNHFIIWLGPLSLEFWPAP